MKPTSYQCVGHERLSSSNASDAQTANLPNGTSAVEITVEGTTCRMTLSVAGDPTTTTGLILQKDQMPWFLPLSKGNVLRFASTAGTPSVIQLAYLQ